MKVPFYLIALISILVSCSKPVDVDPRDQYLGTYDVHLTVVITRGVNILQTETLVGLEQTTVLKGSGANELIFHFDKYTVILNGNSFTIPTHKITSAIATSPAMSFNESGYGSFNGKTINYTTTAIGDGVKYVLIASGDKP